MADCDVAIVGAGVLGLACAATLARNGRSVVVIEQHERIGQETSSRNSGVIHAGLYDPTGSFKAQTCVAGRQLLYARCRRHGVPHRRTGKLLVATDAAETAKLEMLCARGIANGAGALRLLDAREVAALEPRVRAVAGLWSPESGIVDVHALLDCYRNEAVEHGAALCFSTTVLGLTRSDGAWQVDTRSVSGERFVVSAAFVVNAAGLAADRVAAMAGLDVDALGLRLRYCKGDYFALASRWRGAISHLVYPVPVAAGLGIHVTIDLGGKVVAGPDTEYVAQIDYQIDPRKAATFGDALRRYLPDVRDSDLTPDYAGVRPKLQGPGAPVHDFVIAEASAHGAPGLVNLIGIESPGLTASEAIAGRVAALVRA